MLSLSAINDLEKIGIIEVINDYKRRTVYIKRKFKINYLKSTSKYFFVLLIILALYPNLSR